MTTPAIKMALRRVVYAYFDQTNGRYDLTEAMEDAANLLDVPLGNCKECSDWAIIDDDNFCERCAGE